MRAGSSASGARPPGRGQPHAVDVHVGQRLRSQRKLIGLSQGDLAQRVGLTFQQIQKYERGINRISASRLVEFALVLKVPPAWFFEGMPAPHSRATGRRSSRSAEITQELANRESLELVRLYNQIADRRIRERIVALVRAVALESRNTTS